MSGTPHSVGRLDAPDGSRLKPAFLSLFAGIKFISVAKLLHWFSAVTLVLALVGLGMVLVSDVINQLQLTRIHQRAGALSFMLIGASHVSLLLNSRRRFREMLKEVLLGVAFFLWGCEQFVPPGVLATAMDTAVILIFVADLSWIVLEKLRVREQ